MEEESRDIESVTPVAMISKDTGEIIAVWDSISLASRSLGIDKGAIHKVVSGKKKSYKGYFWVSVGLTIYP